MKASHKKHKKSRNAKNGKEEEFFVEVSDYGGVKRAILESMKWALEMLHGYEKYNLIRHERLHASSKLNSQLKEISRLASLLKSKLPATNIRIKPQPTVKPEDKKARHAKGSEAKEQKPVHKEMTELEKLESELKAIEEKLKGIT